MLMRTWVQRGTANLAYAYMNLDDTGRALGYARRAVELAETISTIDPLNTLSLVRAVSLVGTLERREGRLPQACQAFGRANTLFGQLKTAEMPDDSRRQVSIARNEVEEGMEACGGNRRR
jgi:hypothetical protein